MLGIISKHFDGTPKVSVLSSPFWAQASDHLTVLFELVKLTPKIRPGPGRIPSSLYQDTDVRIEVFEAYKASLPP